MALSRLIIVTGYDTWGRAVSYRDAATSATATTTVYDSAGRTSTVTDAKGTTTYGYGTDANGATELRGMPTSLTVSGVGTFSGAYDARGALAVQKLPGGFTQKTKFDTAGVATDLTYLGPDGSGNTVSWLGWHQNNDALGRVRHEDNSSGGAFTGALGSANAHRRGYTYGASGRLTEVRDRTLPATGSLDTTTTPCETRDYTFDKNGNRTQLVTNAATSTGTNTNTNPTTTITNYTYDTADRITGTGYTYDTLGRTLTLPATATPAGTAATLGYYDDDTAHTITTGTTTQTFGLDPAGRRLADTWATSGTTTRTTTRHYTDSSDNPGWSDDTQGSTTTISRYVETLGGGLGAYTTSTNGATATATLTFANLHGDTNATVTLPATGTPAGIDAWNDYNEYGATYTGSGAGGGKLSYGWLGSEQRSVDTAAGLTLMGARLYDSTIGRFLTTDPVVGANENAYGYPNDPINVSDTSGMLPWAAVATVLRAARAAIKLLGKLCGKIKTPSVAIGCSMAAGIMVALIGVYLSTKGHGTVHQYVLAALAGASTALWDLYGRAMFRFLHATSLRPPEVGRSQRADLRGEGGGPLRKGV